MSVNIDGCIDCMGEKGMIVDVDDVVDISGQMYVRERQ